MARRYKELLWIDSCTLLLLLLLDEDEEKYLLGIVFDALGIGPATGRQVWISETEMEAAHAAAIIIMILYDTSFVIVIGSRRQREDRGEYLVSTSSLLAVWNN